MQVSLNLKSFLGLITKPVGLLNLKTPILKNLNVEINCSNKQLQLKTYNSNECFGVFKMAADVQVSGICNILVTELAALEAKLKLVQLEEIQLIVENNNLVVSHSKLGKINLPLYYQDLYDFKTNQPVLAKLKSTEDITKFKKLISEINYDFVLSLTDKKIKLAKKLESGIHYFSVAEVNLDISPEFEGSQYYFNLKQRTALKQLSEPIIDIIFYAKYLELKTNSESIILISKTTKLKQHTNLKVWLSQNKQLVTRLVKSTFATKDILNAINWHRQNQIHKNVVLECQKEIAYIYKSDQPDNRSSLTSLEETVLADQTIKFNLGVDLITELNNFLNEIKLDLFIYKIQIENQAINLIRLNLGQREIYFYERLTLS